MQTINLQVNGNPLIFTGQSVSYEGQEYFYSKISEIAHRGGEFPAFVFTYDQGERISLPYDSKDKEVTMKIFRQIAAMEKKRKEQEAQVEPPIEEPIEPANESEAPDLKIFTPLNENTMPEPPEYGTEFKDMTDQPKIPFYKRKGCLIPIIVLIVIIIAFWLIPGDDSDTSKNTSTTTEATQEAQETTKATTEAATKPTKEKFNAKDYKNIAYKELARNPEKYEYQMVTNSGKVIQVMEGDEETQLRVAIDDNYDKVVYLAYDPSIMKSRILEDDYITYYGISTGVITYESTLGGNITIPGVYATKIKMK